MGLNELASSGNVVSEDCNRAFVVTGYQQRPPGIFGSRESWFL